VAIELVGRDDEVAALRAFLDRAGDGPAALVLEGEAGIGKTTLWLAAVETARAGSIPVLSSRPAEAEQSFAYAALDDLLADALVDVLPDLPAPRRRALEAALLLGETGEGTSIHPRVIGAAVHSALRLLAERGPFLVAVDDVQWLDFPSAGALVFAMRRLEREPVLTLLARRVETGARQTDLERVLPAVAELRIGPMSMGALHRLIRARLGRALPRPVLVRLHDISGGNPFYALELARAVLAAGPTLDPTAPFPFPESLEDLVGERLGGLPDATRRALLVVAALGRPTADEATAAGATPDLLAPAEAARVIEGNGVLRFTHPLLASHLSARASPDERREVHRLLADVVGDPVTSARHLAGGIEGADEQAAAGLEAAAGLSRARGAPSVAAELCEAAVRATPTGANAERHRRLLQAASDHRDAGAAERAAMLADDALRQATSRPARAEALALLANLEAWFGSPPAAVEYFRKALGEAAGTPMLELVIHERLAWVLPPTEGDGAAWPHARAAVELAKRLGDDALMSRALGALAVTQLFADKTSESLGPAARALELALRSGDRLAIDEARVAYAACHTWCWRYDEARRVLLELERSAAENDEPALARAYWYLSLVEQRAGRLELARSYAARWHEVVEQFRMPHAETEGGVVTMTCLAATLQGDEELARCLAERAVAVERRRGKLPVARTLQAHIAVLDLWGGDPAKAVERFDEVDAESRAEGSPNHLWPWAAERCEALLRLGRVREAADLLHEWEAWIRRPGREMFVAELTRSQGLLAEACGSLAEAVLLLESAVARHEALGDPFGRARTLLALGLARRRARQKRPAREAIEAAAAAFEDMGAERWAERARAELASIGGRTRADGLTAAERRVAVLVAEGRTNKEVAAALFLGERTVETHLTHIYAKLDIRSRAQLARALR
jgi:DNA-binding CsgD family transcriptional regulator